LTNFHPLFSGGHASSIPRIVTSWLRDYYDFAVAVPERSDIYRLGAELGYKVYACDFPTKLRELPAVIKSVKRFREIVTDFDPQIVNCNGGADLAITTWALMLRRDIRIVRHHRAVRPLSNDPYHRWLYGRRIAANIYVSQGAMELSHQSGMIPSSPCKVIYNGIDTEYFQPRLVDEVRMRELGIYPSEFVFGSCAGLGGYKRVDLILRATHALKDKYQFKVLLLGSATQAGRHLKMAEDLAISDRVIYAGHQMDIRPYVARFDVGFVLSDNIETLSNAVREMMAMGKPILSSAYTGLRENFKDEVQGFFVPPGDLNRLIAKMERFLQMGVREREAMGLRAREHAVSNFERSKTLVPLNELYASLL
jgi:L-malate glycosyltransferase